MRSTVAIVVSLPLALGQAIPGTGENGEMGGIFGMGVTVQVPPGLQSIMSGLSNLFGGGAKGSGGAPPKGSSAPKSSGGSLMGSFDPASLVPKGPEYPTGKTSLADYYNGGSGPYPAHFVTEPSLANHTIYAPKVPPPQNVKMPVLIWGNGGCMSTGTPYGAFLAEVASYGYLAIANGPPGGSPPGLDLPASAERVLPGPNGEVLYTKEAAAGNGIAKVKDMLDAMDWVTKGNAKKYGNIDTETFITAGSSCGGLEAYSAAYKNPKVKLIGIYNSGVINPQKVPLLKELTAAVVYIQGGPIDVGYTNSERDYESLPPSLPAYKASLNSGHMGTFFTKNGGKYGKVSVALLEWMFRNNQTGKAMWTEPASPGSMVSEGWNVTYKNFK
jgi:hypothetical protein